MRTSGAFVLGAIIGAVDQARADSAVKPVLPDRSDACGGAVVRS
jgi:hypothetical protein